MNRLYGIISIGLVLLLFALIPPGVRAAPSTLPAGFTRELVAYGLDLPTAFVFDGTNILVSSKNGRVQVVQPNGQIRPTAYVSLTVSTNAERGVDGIAIDPHYPQKPYVYVYYATAPGSLNYNGVPADRVSRFTTVNGVGTNETVLLDNIPNGHEAEHNGGDLQFGTDGMLYVAVGDGGYDSSRKLDSLDGKILRITPKGRIPHDNPYYAQKNARGEIYATGFRNPFRISFRPSNNSLIVGDVGWGLFEELDLIKPGQDYGWPRYEGPCLRNVQCDPSQTNFKGTTKPLWYYAHGQFGDPSNAVIGGVFAEHTNYPAPYQGSYFFGDVEGWVRYNTVNPNDKMTGSYAFDNVLSPTQFRIGPEGDLYVSSLYDGAIYKYVYTAPGAK